MKQEEVNKNRNRNRNRNKEVSQNNQKRKERKIKEMKECQIAGKWKLSMSQESRQDVFKMKNWEKVGTFRECRYV